MMSSSFTDVCNAIWESFKIIFEKALYKHILKVQTVYRVYSEKEVSLSLDSSLFTYPEATFITSCSVNFQEPLHSQVFLLYLSYISCSFFFFKHLYWSIIALQWCVSFCFITKWISYTYTYIPISPPSCVSLPPSLSHPSRWSQSTELISLC